LYTVDDEGRVRVSVGGKQIYMYPGFRYRKRKVTARFSDDEVIIHLADGADQGREVYRKEIPEELRDRRTANNYGPDDRNIRVSTRREVRVRVDGTLHSVRVESRYVGEDVPVEIVREHGAPTAIIVYRPGGVGPRIGYLNLTDAPAPANPSNVRTPTVRATGRYEFVSWHLGKNKHIKVRLVVSGYKGRQVVALFVRLW